MTPSMLEISEGTASKVFSLDPAQLFTRTMDPREGAVGSLTQDHLGRQTGES